MLASQAHSISKSNLRISFEALALVGKNEKFDLLFTDVIMPGAMNKRRA
jgi:CheY-like chemotaxis protein